MQTLLFLLEIAAPPIANPASVQEAAFRTAGEKLLEDDKDIKNLLTDLYLRGDHSFPAIEEMLRLLKEVLALNRPWKPFYGKVSYEAPQSAKAHARFNRLLACIYASSIGYELYRENVICKAVEQTGYLFRPFKDHLRIMVIQRDMEDLILQYQDVGAIEALAAHIRKHQEPHCAVPKLFEDILSSQKARIALCNRFVLQNPPLSKCLKVLDRLIFEKETGGLKLRTN